MLGDNESIFDNIPYSIPNNTHSLSVVTRTPTTGYSQSSKYMPDYGGILEVPNGHFKNNGLGRGQLPFYPKPHYVRAVDLQEKTLKPRCAQCLAVVKNKSEPAGGQDCFTTIRAIGKTLYLDSIGAIPCETDDPPETCKFQSYAHVPYSNEITGIKYKEHKRLDDLVLVKFDQGIKLLKINKSYQVAQLSDADAGEPGSPFPQQTAVDFIESFPAKPQHKTKDACMLHNNRNSIGIAISNSDSFQVKLYDIAQSKRLISTISTKFRDGRSLQIGENIASRTRGQVIRSFASSKKTMEYLQQLESDPSHLHNMVVTTSLCTAMVDPRVAGLSNVIVDLTQLSSRTPMELLRGTEFSWDDNNQIYSMSNVNLRVFDRRYLLSPVMSLAHMLDSACIESMDLSRINLKNHTETLCLSAEGRLAFMTFDRSRAFAEGDLLVTPRSAHPPIHEPSPSDITGNKVDELYGLATAKCGVFNGNVLFSVIQLSQEGDVCVRGYQPNTDSSDSPIHESQAKLVIKQEKRATLRTSRRSLKHPELEKREFNNENNVEPSTANKVGTLSLCEVDEIARAGDKLTSQRALKRLQYMRDKLIGKI